MLNVHHRGHGVAGLYTKDVAETKVEQVTDYAKERGIRVRPRPSDRFVKAVSRLSDGVTDLDHVEELLIELGRAGVISSFQRGLLQVHYLR